MTSHSIHQNDNNLRDNGGHLSIIMRQTPSKDSNDYISVRSDRFAYREKLKYHITLYGSHHVGNSVVLDFLTIPNPWGFILQVLNKISTY